MESKLNYVLKISDEFPPAKKTKVVSIGLSNYQGKTLIMYINIHIYLYILPIKKFYWTEIASIISIVN